MTDRTYAAELDDTDTVVRVIVGTADWAGDSLGGRWVNSPVKVGAGWRLWADGLRPPRPFPSWTWQDGAWTAPIPMPDVEGAWVWDEDAGAWTDAEPET